MSESTSKREAWERPAVTFEHWKRIGGTASTLQARHRSQAEQAPRHMLLHHALFQRRPNNSAGEPARDLSLVLAKGLIEECRE